MPYKKNYRRRGKRTKYGNRGKVYGKAAYQLYKDVSMLKNLINVEFKTHDVSHTEGALAQTAEGFLLNGLAKGDNYNTRDGRQVRWKSIQIDGYFLQHSSASNTNMRVVLVIDKQPSEVEPAFLQIYDTESETSHRKLDNRKRFVILRSFNMILSTQGDKAMKNFKIFRKLDMKTVYDASNTGDISDISSNALYLFFVSNQPTNRPSVQFNSRMRFIDN